MIYGQIACLTLLALLLARAAWTDLRSRIISNPLNITIALLAIVWWGVCGLDPWGIVTQLAIGLGVFAFFTLLFTLNLIGGGDVKLLGALGLWLPLQQMATMLVWMAMLGGILSIVMLVAHRIRKGTLAPEVPYGVAIVVATLPIIANRILTIPAA
ncbi:prepilin peptidase [Sphingomonas naphthae]|uniref:Prepilin peptidase n=1 Tax=Sphingomonas naphthae TaxID=1813468 RepID=A0ABY7TGG0_9SPHN|nr:prepilin peptidase [Sphingomonas naphthae]WCT72148.1 prepilin peptidase [Sphingomonas naphthae]